VPGRNWLPGTLFGVGTDVVLRSMPPLKVYRLRYSPAQAELAERSGAAGSHQQHPAHPGHAHRLQ
jgi:hypothetical protein